MYWLNGTRKCQRSKCYIGSRKERKTVIYSNKCCKKKNLKELSEYSHSTSGTSKSGTVWENSGSGSGMVVPRWELATTMNSVVHGWILSLLPLHAITRPSYGHWHAIAYIAIALQVVCHHGHHRTHRHPSHMPSFTPPVRTRTPSGSPSHAIPVAVTCPPCPSCMHSHSLACTTVAIARLPVSPILHVSAVIPALRARYL